MILIDNKKSDYKILLPINCSQGLDYAAYELQSFLYKSTGALLELTRNYDGGERVISIGLTEVYKHLNVEFNLQPIGSDGFIIKTINQCVLLNANTDRGVLFAVYEFLERFLNIRFISKDTHNT